MERMVWAMVLMIAPAAALAEARFEWTETTSKECRAYFQQAYIDQASSENRTNIPRTSSESPILIQHDIFTFKSSKKVAPSKSKTEHAVQSYPAG